MLHLGLDLRLLQSVRNAKVAREGRVATLALDVGAVLGELFEREGRAVDAEDVAVGRRGRRGENLARGKGKGVELGDEGKRELTREERPRRLSW